MTTDEAPPKPLFNLPAVAKPSYVFMAFWLFALIYAITDILNWSTLSSQGVSQPQYNALWNTELYGFTILALVLVRSAVVAAFLWLFNFLSIESVFYYILQGHLVPTNLPWLTITSSNVLYLVTVIFVVALWYLIKVEARLKRRVVFKEKL